MDSDMRVGIGDRLKELRTNKKLSQPQLAQLLSEKLTDLINLAGDNGKAVVSQLERGARGLTIEMAFAYSTVFDVTLDYLYGRDEQKRPEYKPITEQTGLSEASIKRLGDFVKEKGKSGLYSSEIVTQFINLVIENISEYDIEHWYGDYLRVLVYKFDGEMGTVNRMEFLNKTGLYPIHSDDALRLYSRLIGDHIKAIIEGKDDENSYEVNARRILEPMLKDLNKKLKKNGSDNNAEA